MRLNELWQGVKMGVSDERYGDLTSKKSLSTIAIRVLSDSD